MSFRRNKGKARRWETWLQQHRDALLACSVPQVLLERESHWIYFLEHGYFTPRGSVEPIIDIDRMERSQIEQLCLLLEGSDYYPNSSTLNALQYRLKRGRHAETTG
jgi:hypothetical protein